MCGCGCIAALLALITPRLVLLVLWIFTDYISSVFDSFIWPLLGFIFLPLTTLAYAWSIHTYHGVHGLGLLTVIVAFLIDIGAFGGGDYSRRRGYR
ncbi:MAG: hypothetical protein ACYC56_03630 [Candidatus Aquicultor sp.]